MLFEYNILFNNVLCGSLFRENRNELEFQNHVFASF